ncbi:hypothetical protein HK102_007233, partial [Quaeritorhiza haematococci]
WRELSEGEKRQYLAAVQCLQRPGTSVTGDGSSRYDDFTRVHLAASELAHGAPAFLPWHRGLLVAYESALKTCSGNSSLTLTYWDSGFDSQAPESSPVLRDFGGDYAGGCARSGPFAALQLAQPTPHCLVRRFSRGAIRAPELNTLLLQERSYDNFRSTLEMGLHASVHNWIGGDMTQMFSSNDPIFWLHHTNVDRLWYLYQTRYTERADDYEGTARDGRPVALSDQMQFWQVQDLLGGRPLQVRELQLVSDWCYTYSDSVTVDETGDDLPLKKRHFYQNFRQWQAARHAARLRASAAEGAAGAAPAAPVEVGSPNNKHTPATDDRSDIYNIRYPEPIPEDWALRNFIDPSALVQFQQIEYDFVDYVNGVDGYVSYSALVHTQTKDGSEPTYRSLSPDEAEARRVVRDTLCEQGKKALNLHEIGDVLKKAVDQVVDWVEAWMQNNMRAYQKGQ